MRYMLWMAGDGAVEPSPAEIMADPAFQGWERMLAERGIDHRGERLRPPSEAVTVRVRNGEVLVTDGPFADTKEHIGGYGILDATDLDQAIEVAAGHPAALIEIRPFHTEEHH